MSFASIALTIDLFGINVALPDIGRDLGLSDTQLQWVVTAYYLGLAAPLAAAGRIGDLFGRRRMLVMGTLVFAVGSLLAAVSETGDVLVVARLVAGIGAAFVTALSLTLVSDAFHDERRAVAIGTWSGIGALGAAAGPLIAGVVTQQLGWRWIFWLNLPFSVVTIAVTLLVVAESRDPDKAGVDVLGIVLSIAALGFITFGLVEGPNFGWTSPWVVGILVLGVALLAAFVVVEVHRDDPIVDLGWLVRPPAAGDALTAIGGNAAFAAVMFFVTLYYQEVRGRGPIATGIVFLAMTIPLGIMSPFVGRALRRFAPEVLLGVGMLVLAASAGLFLFVTETSTVLVLLAALAVSGVGQAIVFNVSNIEAVGSVPVARSGMAAGVVSSVRQVGSLLGLAATGAAFAAASVGSLLTGNATAADGAEFLDGFHAAMVALLVICLAGAVAAPLAHRRRLTPGQRDDGGSGSSLAGSGAFLTGSGTSLTGTSNRSRTSSSGTSL
jgi:EmrB/QacA subfamily drug resistance transporter